MKLSLYVGETRDLERSLAAILDAVVAWGDQSHFDERPRELAKAGADEVVLWPFPAGDDPADSLTATLDAMQELAAR
jgi:hypothetical protein